MSEESKSQTYRDLDSPWQEKEILEELYVERDLKKKEVANRLGCSESTIGTWLKKHGLDGDLPEIDLSQYGDEPWEDRELLEELYIEEQLGGRDISIVLNCSGATISKWLDKHGIEKRSRSQAVSLGHGKHNYVPLIQHTDGYEEWKVGKDAVHVHRLMALCKWDLEDIKGMHVHHKSGIPWDNRMDNLELVPPTEHQSHHRKITGLDRIRIAELYEHGDLATRPLADVLDYDISSGTVLRIHKEFYGDNT